MNCNSYQELITGAVDGELSHEEKEHLSLHLETCVGCRSEYDSEVSLKKFIRETLVGHHAPAHLLRSVSDSIEDVEVSSDPTWIERLKVAFSPPFVRPALALGLTVVLALVFLTGQPSHDIIEESLAKYELASQGSFIVHYASSEPALLRTFFADKTDFPVLIPEMKDCTLLGGVLEENPTGAVAEVIYDHGSQKIFLSQTSWNNLGAGGGPSLDDDVRDELLRSNLFIETLANGNTVVLWKKGVTLCTAVSAMTSDDLIYCLTSGDPDLLSR